MNMLACSEHWGIKKNKTATLSWAFKHTHRTPLTVSCDCCKLIEDNKDDDNDDDGDDDDDDDDSGTVQKEL